MGKESRGKQTLRPRRKGVGQTSQVEPQGSDHEASVLTGSHLDHNSIPLDAVLRVDSRQGELFKTL